MSVVTAIAAAKKQSAAGVRIQWGSHTILSQLSSELRTNKLFSR